MRILSLESLALCIDVQERLFPHIDEADALESTLLRLIQGLQILSIPMIVSEQYRKGLGQTILAVQETLTQFSPLEKSCFSCADDATILSEIRRINRQTIILFGIEAHVCVLQTALDLIQQGFTVVMVEDCVGSRNKNDKNVAIRRMQSEGVIVSTYESLLFELCRESGTALFKQISRIVK